MSQGFSIRTDLYQKLKAIKDERAVKTNMPVSFSDVINSMFYHIEELNRKLNYLQEATVTQEGRITKTLAGKTILYRIKEPDGVITKEQPKPET